MADLANQFLTAKRHLVDTFELALRSFADYFGSCQRLFGLLGKQRLVLDLAADDFQRLRFSLAKTLGPVSLGNEIQRIRVMFKFGYDAGLIDRPVRYILQEDNAARRKRPTAFANLQMPPKRGTS